MSFTYGFYNSKNGDRKYNARQIAQIFDGIILDGVFMTIGDCFAIKPSSGMSVTVGSGRAWFDHTWSYNDSEMIMTATESDVVLDRIDAIVLEINGNDSTRKNAIKWVTGTAASNPVKPNLINIDKHHQYPLGYITIPANSTEITAANIEYVVGTSECPFVTGVLQGMNIDNLIAQWNAEFDVWFEHMKDVLSGDVAGNLQLQIDENTDNLQILTDRTLKSYDINAIDIDSTPGNWTVDISEEGHGTIPKIWVNVTQTTSGHFFVQTAIRCDTRNTNAYENGEVWFRDKYDGATWSKWSKLAREQDVMPITDVKYIKYVTSLPSSPSADTLYLIKK